MHLKSGLIREVAFGGSNLIREVAFGGSGLIREVAFGGSDLIRGELLYMISVSQKMLILHSFYQYIFPYRVISLCTGDLYQTKYVDYNNNARN